MLNDEICKLRDKLNESIITGQDYNITYKLSIELDELIAKYYRKRNTEEKSEDIEKNIVSKGNIIKKRYVLIK